jgi:hypothetical protein
MVINFMKLRSKNGRIKAKYSGDFRFWLYFKLLTIFLLFIICQGGYGGYGGYPGGYGGYGGNYNLLIVIYSLTSTTKI